MVTEGIMFSLIVGAYGYTFATREKHTASREDIHRLEDRIDTLYEHLLNKPMPLPKNGEKNGK